MKSQRLQKFTLIYFIMILLIIISTESVFAENTQSKVTITIRYQNDTSPSYFIIKDINQNIIISQKYSWPGNNHDRINLIGYRLDNNSQVNISRNSTGNFTLSIPTNSDHSITFLTNHQYQITTFGKIDQTGFLPNSPTGDDWFDSGTTIQVITPYLIQESQDTRKQLIGWSVDDPDINIITKKEFGDFTSEPIHITGQHTLILKYSTQYLVKVLSDFGRPTGSGWYDSNSIINIGVIPENDLAITHTFAGWQGSTLGNGKIESTGVMVDSPKVLVANWNVDYSNISIISITTIALAVAFTIYLKRKKSKR